MKYVRLSTAVCRLPLVYDLQKRRCMLVNMNILKYIVVCRASFGIQIWWMERILAAMARCHGGLL